MKILHEAHISQGQAVSIPEYATGCSVLCLAGMVWLTRENDHEDYLMKEGTVFTAQGPGLIVVEGIKDSLIRVMPRRHDGKEPFGHHPEPGPA